MSELRPFEEKTTISGTQENNIVKAVCGSWFPANVQINVLIETKK